MTRKWKGRRPRVPDEHVPELLRLRAERAKARAITDAIPTVRELAERWGMSRSTVERYLYKQLPKRMATLEPAR